MLTDHLFQDIPDLCGTPFHQLLGRLDGGGQPTQLQFAEDEGFEQLQGHTLGQTALMQLQGRPHHDYRTTGVVDPLAQQVLAEAALFTFDHVGQGLERTPVGAGDGPTAPAVVEQRIHRLLQHAFLVTYDDVRGVQIQQSFQTVVAVDHPAVQIVQIGGGETTAIQRHQGSQLRRQHRQYGHHHPLRTVARFVQGLQ